MKTIMDEVLEEINDRASVNREAADALLSEWFTKCGLMLEWVATGIIPDGAENDAFINQVTGPERVAIDARH